MAYCSKRTEPTNRDPARSRTTRQPLQGCDRRYKVLQVNAMCSDYSDPPTPKNFFSDGDIKTPCASTQLWILDDGLITQIQEMPDHGKPQ